MPPAQPDPPQAKAWSKANKTEILLGLGAAVVTIALYMRSKSKTGSTTGTTSAPPSSITYVPATSASEVGYPTSYGYGGSPPGGGSTTKTTRPPARAGSLTGVSTASTGYASVPSWAQASALMTEGQTLYWEPTPGTYEPATKTGQLAIAPGTDTPLFLRSTGAG